VDDLLSNGELLLRIHAASQVVMVHGAALSFNPDPALNLFFLLSPQKYWIKFLFYTSTFILTGRLCPVYKLIIGIKRDIRPIYYPSIIPLPQRHYYPSLSGTYYSI
jgi:hypothetical protein